MSTDFTTKPSTRQRGPVTSVPVAPIVPPVVPGNTSKWPKQHQQLSDMGFESSAVSMALERAAGRMDVATAILCDTLPPVPKPQSGPVGIPAPVTWGSNTTNPALWKNVPSSGSSSSTGAPRVAATGPTYANNIAAAPSPMASSAAPAAVPAAPLSKAELAEAKHVRFMSTFKVQRCRKQLEKQPSHDKRSCLFYHGKSDRRRNPYVVEYSCSECTENTENSPCPDGDACLKAHNMLERMFHPDLFKISMCQKPHSCERAHLCAFAHSSEDHRVAPPKTANLAYEKSTGSGSAAATAGSSSASAHSAQLAHAAAVKSIPGLPPAPAAAAKMARSASPLPTPAGMQQPQRLTDDLPNNAASPGAALAGSSTGVAGVGGDSSKPACASTSGAVISMLLGGEHPGLLATQQRLIDLIRLSGDEGIISSEVPKRYEMHYGEKLELEAVSSAGGGGSAAVEKVKIKDLVLTQPGVTVSMHKGVQPRYVFDEQQAEEDKALLRQQEQQLQDKMQAAIARAVGQAAATRIEPALARDVPPPSQESYEPAAASVAVAAPAVVVAPSTRRRPGGCPPAIAMNSSQGPIGIQQPISGFGNTFTTLSGNTQQRGSGSQIGQPLNVFNRSRSNSQDYNNNDPLGGIQGLGSSSHVTSGRESPSLSASEYDFAGGDTGGFSSLLSGLGLDSGDDMQQFGDHMPGPSGGLFGGLGGEGGLDSLTDHNSGTSSSRISPATLGGASVPSAPSSRRRGPDIPTSSGGNGGGSAMNAPPGLPQLSQHKHNANPYSGHLDNDDVDDDDGAPLQDYDESYDAGMMSNPYAQDLAKEALADAEQTVRALQSEMHTRDRQTAADRLEIGALQLQLQEVQTAKAAADAATEAVMQEWRSLSHKLTAVQKQSAEKDTELTARRGAHRDVELESRKLHQETSNLTAELTALRKKVTQMEPELEQAKKKITGLTTDNKRLDSKLKEEEKARQVDMKAYKKKEDEIHKLKQAVAEEKSKCNATDNQLLAATNSVSDITKAASAQANALNEACDELETVKAESQRLTKENKTLNTKLTALQKMLNHNPHTATAPSNGGSSSSASPMPAPAPKGADPAGASASDGVRQIQAANGFTRVLTSSAPAGSLAGHEYDEAAEGADRNNGVIKRQKGTAENKDQATEKQEKSVAMKQTFAPKAQCDLEGCCLTGIYICGSCKAVGYCGLAHQKEHWRFHRKSCANIKRTKEKEMIGSKSGSYVDGLAAVGQAMGALLDTKNDLF